jgi:hypothetical protein
VGPMHLLFFLVVFHVDFFLFLIRFFSLKNNLLKILGLFDVQKVSEILKYAKIGLPVL